MGLNLNCFKGYDKKCSLQKMARNGRKWPFSLSFSFRNRLYLSFVKIIYVVGEKMTKNGGKMVNTKLCVT